MRARQALRLAALAAIAALSLAACTTIPSSGPVNEGTGVIATPDPFVPIAERPRLDASAPGIVSGFVTAAGAGFDSDFSVARQFLTPSAAATWDPTDRVIVYDSGALNTKFDEKTNTVTYDVPVLATLDDSGRLVEAADGTRETLTFTMTQNAEGQWRIASLEDGTILAGAAFERLFTQVNLVFASIDESTQVPELRWLPRNKVATLAAQELVEGPSPNLAPAVHTGFPATAALEVSSVLVTDGVAAVQLTAESAGTPEQRALAQEQMELTLTSIPGIVAVDVTAGGVTLAGAADVQLKPAPLPGTDAAAFVAGRLGVFDGTDVWQVPDSVGGLPAGSSGLAQTFGAPTAAWIVDGRQLVISSAIEGGTGALTKADDSASEPTSTMKTVALYEGTHLVAPSADRHSWIWTTEAGGSDAFTAVKASAAPTTIPVDWLRGTTVQAIAVSWDGVRIAVLARTGDKQILEVASIVRGDDGTPLTIGEPQQVGADLGPSIDLAWVDDLTLAVLGQGGGDVPSDLWLTEVGGLTSAQKAPTYAVDLTARDKERSLLVVDSDGVVFAKSGTVWSKVTQGPTELAFAG